MTNHPIEPHPVLVRVAKALSGDTDKMWEMRPADKADLRKSIRDGWAWTESRAHFLDDARAALEALREPTHDMVEAGEEAALAASLSSAWPPCMGRDAWTAMINTIIGESA